MIHDKGSELTPRTHIACSCGDDRQVIVSHKKILQFHRHLYNKRSQFMLRYWIHSWTTMCLASSSCHQQAILEEEISTGRNFCKLVFNYQNFCLTKISRYTVVWLLAMSRQLSNQPTHCLLLLWVILTSGLGTRLDLHVMTHLHSLCGWGGLLE